MSFDPNGVAGFHDYYDFTTYDQSTQGHLNSDGPLLRKPKLRLPALDEPRYFGRIGAVWKKRTRRRFPNSLGCELTE